MSEELRYGPTAQQRAENPLLNSTNERSELASATLLEDAERHAGQLEKRVLDLDRRRQALQREIEIISNIHQWLNGERHRAAALVDRIKAASSNGPDQGRRT